jgi:hypothetical protein
MVHICIPASQCSRVDLREVSVRLTELQMGRDMDYTQFKLKRSDMIRIRAQIFSSPDHEKCLRPEVLKNKAT